MGRFAGRNVIVTGAAHGIGLAAATRLASEGARLLLVDLDEAGLAAAREQVGKDRCETQVADVADEAAVAGYVERAASALGRIDGFFNNAGIVGPLTLTEDYAAADFERVMRVNTNGVLFGLKHVLKVMRGQGSGAVVNTASITGISAVGSQSAYTASKHAVVGLTRNAAVEYGPFGIQVNAIAPGAITTRMFEMAQRERVGDQWEEAAKAFAQTNPMQRFGQPEEVAALVAFLLSGEAGYINGAVVPIDGGQTIRY